MAGPDEEKKEPKSIRADNGAVEDKTEGPKLVLRGDKPLRIEPKKPVKLPAGGDEITSPAEVAGGEAAGPAAPGAAGPPPASRPGVAPKLADVENHHAALAMAANAQPKAAAAPGVPAPVLWISAILLLAASLLLGSAVGIIPLPI